MENKPRKKRENLVSPPKLKVKSFVLFEDADPDSYYAR